MSAPRPRFLTPPMWWRLALVMTVVMLIPLSVVCWGTVHTIDAQVDRYDISRAGGVAARFARELRGRLQMADAWVSYLTATDAGADEPSLRRRVLASDTLAGVVLMPWSEAFTERANGAGVGGLSDFAATERLALTVGQSVLRIVTTEKGSAGVYLAHLVNVAGSRQVGFFEIAPAWLWRDTDDLPDRSALAIVDSQGRVIYRGSELAPGLFRLFGRAPADTRHPQPSVRQNWQQGGAAWRAMVTQMGLASTRIAGGSPWNIAVYDQASATHPGLLTLAPTLLALLTLSALCVLLGTWYLSRRWQPVLARLDGALAALRQGAFQRVDASGAADAPLAVAHSYNLAIAELQLRLAAQACLAEIDRLLFEAEELEQALEPMLLRVRTLTGSQATAVALLDRDAPAHARSFVVSLDSNLGPVSRVNIDEEVSQELRNSPQELLVPPHHLERYSFLAPLRALGAESCCVWPVMIGERMAAILSAAYQGAKPPSREQLSFGAECAARLQVALSNAERGERLYRQAHFDSLTSLPNRLLFHDRLSQELRNAAENAQRSALLYIDLDHFKKVNDSVGHVAGDQLLTIVAQRLRACVKEGDTVARLGGDEFTVILRNLVAAEAAGMIAERIIEALQRPVNIAGRDHFVRASIGITLFPDDATTIEAVMRNADLAMYHAKDGGRARAMFFDSTMTRALSPIAHSGLFRALRRREFALHYQPQFDLRTGQVAGLEVLLRWQSPREGVRLPKDFIPAAEESGLIVDIGTWVVESACHQLALWREQGIAPARLALNVSVQQLRLTDFAGLVRRSLERASLPPQMLELEITEMMFAEEQAQQTLRTLAALGVRLALDDFGTGYSSLNYLRQHPVDAIKIDRSFMQEVPENTQAGTLASTIIEMAHALDKQVIAEGVETLQQLDFLYARDCDFAQGFVLARPMGVAEVSELLSARQGLTLLVQRAAG